MIIFDYLSILEDFFWYIGFIVICLSGVLLTIHSKGFQFKALLNIRKNVKVLIQESKNNQSLGVNPLKLYFASVGGMIGIGNIVNVGVAVLIGGPGSIFWMWVASFCGMLVKYCEIYLGVKYRVRNSQSGYDGGPMFYIQEAFKGVIGKVLAYVTALLLCIYCIEIFQFAVIVDNLNTILPVDKNYIIAAMLFIVLYVGLGGINRLANTCAIMMPVFMLGYLVVCLYIIVCNIYYLPEALMQIIVTAFTEQAAIGAFAGSTLLLSGRTGTAAAVYSGDIGIGYDSILQSETKIADPRKQATLSIYALFSDTLICSMTTLVIAITGSWHKFHGIESTKLIFEVLREYIPYSDIFMTIVLFFAGYTTITAFFTAGIKGARFLSAKYGVAVFVICAIFAFMFFSYLTPDKAQIIIQITGGMLILINIFAILRLKNQIDFNSYET